MKVVLASLNELDSILDIYAHARAFMKANANPTQWGSSWPSKEVLIEDINLNRLFLIKNDDNDVLAVFALIVGKDPCYLDIKGSWLNDKPYITIHRLASSFKEKGIFHFRRRTAFFLLSR